MTPLRLVIHGAAGRMGQRIVALAAADPEFRLVAALDRAGHPRLGEDAGLVAGTGSLGVPLATTWTEPADMLVDFSTAQAVPQIVTQCAQRRVPVVVATTGLEPDQRAALEKAAQAIPVLWAPSMSLAVNLAMKLAETAGRALADHPTGADVEILERHHRYKEDAPSGTALMFGRILAQAMGLTRHQHGREGRPGQRPHDEIGYHAVRTGDNPGEHTIVFGLLGESLEITVKATNRDCYAHGALAAAKFVAQQKPGLYGMQDVLGL
jgi:4-hydroxy-tetrahydrodipicolinate reductase